MQSLPCMRPAMHAIKHLAYLFQLKLCCLTSSTRLLVCFETIVLVVNVHSSSSSSEWRPPWGAATSARAASGTKPAKQTRHCANNGYGASQTYHTCKAPFCKACATEQPLMQGFDTRPLNKPLLQGFDTRPLTHVSSTHPFCRGLEARPLTHITSTNPFCSGLEARPLTHITSTNPFCRGLTPAR